VLGPGVEVVGSGDGTSSTLALPDGPVLGESGSASDGRLVGASVGALDVGCAVRGDAAELSNAGRAGVEATVALNDVVLGLGAVDPAVDGKVRTAAAGVVAARVDDLSDESQPCYKSVGESKVTYLALPVCQPIPATTSVLPPHFREKVPAFKLFWNPAAPPL
jgi:hypothetical protein